MINKLVRDNIPDIIKSSGKNPICKRVKDEKIFFELLKSKLEEEVEEYLASGEIIELCDVVEVIYALLNIQGISQLEFDAMRNKKASINGIFENRIFLERIEE